MKGRFCYQVQIELKFFGRLAGALWNECTTDRKVTSNTKSEGNRPGTGRKATAGLIKSGIAFLFDSYNIGMHLPEVCMVLFVSVYMCVCACVRTVCLKHHLFTRS